MASNIIKKTDGFTLIEVIITLVVTSILALMVLQFTKTATVHGTKTSTWFAKNTQLQMSMEKINATYRTMADNETIDLPALRKFADTVANGTNGSPDVDDKLTGYISFNQPNSNEKIFDATSIQSSQGSNSVLVVTLKNDEQKLRSCFVE